VERWQKIQHYFGKHRSIDEIIAKVRELSKRSRGTTNVSTEKEKKSTTSKDVSNNAHNTASDTKEDVWTVEQQKSLEMALKEAKSLPMDQRWEKVASMIHGKTKEQCIERYKFIRDQLLAKKNPT